MSDFDPYHQWLEIPPDEQPPTPHRLLGIAPDETDKETIREAALQRNAFIRQFSLGEQGKIAERLLNEIAAARDNILAGNVQTAVETPSPVETPIEPDVEKADPSTATPASPPLFSDRTPLAQQETQSIAAEWSTFQPAKKPRRRRQQRIWKRPAVIGVSVVGVIGVFVLVISLMSSGDADPVVSNTPPVVASPLIPSPEPAPAQATANTLPPSLREGLVAYYLFNGNAQDESGNGHNGKIEGPKPIGDRYGKADSAYAFSGGTDVIRIADSELLRSGHITISAWVFTTSSRPGALVAKTEQRRQPAGEQYELFLSRSVGFFIKRNSGGRPGAGWQRLEGVGEVALARWMMVTATWDGHSQKILIDGRMQGKNDNAIDGDIDDVLGGELLIGSSWAPDLGHFTGSIDDVRIYNRALSEAEVKALYDYESTPPVPPTAPTTESITNTIGMKLNKIPAGTFTMGSPPTEKDRDKDEQQHQVTITKPFYMQTTEVTQGQWKAVMGTEPWKGEEFVKEGPDYPATYVSWDDGVAYCKKLSDKEGKTYRLPTEAEWEYACRAGTQTAWIFGDDDALLGQYAWYNKNAWDINEEYAHQVRLKKPNAWGLYDMYGNAWEWCSDYYEKDYYQQSPTNDPQGPGPGFSRVLRGGSWVSFFTRLARSAYRRSYDADYRSHNNGFRLVRELD